VVWLAIFGNFERLTSLAGRSPMLSSRRVIWRDVRELISHRPTLGYGYWGLWDRADLTLDTYTNVGAQYASAHNSVLEVLIMLGFVGLLCYLAIAACSVGGTVRSAWKAPSTATWFWTVVIVYLVAENLTESFVLWHSYIWVLFLAAGFITFNASVTPSRRRWSGHRASQPESGLGRRTLLAIQNRRVGQPHA
jgi:exopolysaccharide production protein ExoQ